MARILHIVCHDVPYPLDYGGVVDLYCKLSALSQEGVQIQLHCFDYGRGHQPILKKYCTAVHYYSRQVGHKGFSHKYPYIVTSRINCELEKNLLKDDHPILLEGIHCSWILHDPRFKERRIFLRLHNVEFQYYDQLYRSSASFFKKLYYWHESRLLKRYEARIAGRVPIAAVSEKDLVVYKEQFHAQQIIYLPVFLPYDKVSSAEGIGMYCLYHGNLSVAENEKAATWLLTEVFNDIRTPLVIAGKDPSDNLVKLAHRRNHTCLVANPTELEMQDMIAKAQINLIPSFNNTGIKLKLLNAIFNGRHCVCHAGAVEGTGLESACHIASTPAAFKSVITQLFNMPFAEEEIRLRKKLMHHLFNNPVNAQKLIQWIW